MAVVVVPITHDGDQIITTQNDGGGLIRQSKKHRNKEDPIFHQSVMIS